MTPSKFPQLYAFLANHRLFSQSRLNLTIPLFLQSWQVLLLFKMCLVEAFSTFGRFPSTITPSSQTSIWLDNTALLISISSCSSDHLATHVLYIICDFIITSELETMHVLIDLFRCRNRWQTRVESRRCSLVTIWMQQITCCTCYIVSICAHLWTT